MSIPLSCVFVDDGLGRAGCTAGPACQAVIRTFRQTGSDSRRSGYNYVPLLPFELPALSLELREHHISSLAVFDLDAYPNFEAVMNAARKRTEKRGRINREIGRAERLGYYVKPFAFGQHVPDIVAIHGSKALRDNRPIKGRYYHLSLEELGGAPKAHVAISPPICPQHNTTHWGVFRREDGYRQGNVQTDEQLVGYIELRRLGNSAWYSRIMGHGDHLKQGVMYLLHYRLVAALMAARAASPRYLVFYEYARATTDHRVHWKSLAMFEPHYLLYADDRPLALPTDPLPLNRGMLTLKITLGLAHEEAVATAATIGTSSEWLDALYRIWVVENARAPALASNILQQQPPTADALMPLATYTLPSEALTMARSVAVVLCGKERGIDSLLLLHEKKLNDVMVFHTSEQELKALQAAYNPSWRYRLGPPAGVDLRHAAPDTIIADITCAALPQLPADYNGSIILGVPAKDMKAIGLTRESREELASHFGRRLNLPLVCRSIVFRWGEPDEAYWLWFEVERSSLGYKASTRHKEVMG